MELLPQFILAVLVLMAVPGPDMAYCITTGISRGAKGVLFAALGVGAGGLVLTVAVAVIIFLSTDFNPKVFSFLQIFGSLYLLYLGISILTAKHEAAETANPKIAHRGIFLRGVITNISNPKVLIFFISFIPQFIPAHAPSPHFVALILGTTLCAIGIIINFLLGLSGISLQFIAAKKIYGRPASDCITASVFILIAVIFLTHYIGNW